MYDEDNRARSTYYKSVVEKKGGKPFLRKPYLTPAKKGKQKKSADGKETSGGGVLLKCFKCGELGNCANKCKNAVLKCYNCGKADHRKVECRSNRLTYFNYGEQDHISTQCQKPKRASATAAQTTGRVFSFSGADISNSDNFI
ncbi:uncharacterized protein LOC127131871 [Lathyrus oleraceus]|uniref:uncharacterized protein LOC127131871 n=1 Tax=Pisum sativum TaxID=3888 RepID=UPI0021D0C912|nr:uncharacterized protein LOC127131871 [Pisum sativum]